MVFNIIGECPSPEIYNFLRSQVGWGTVDLELVRHALPKSLYFVSVYQDQKVIGMGRVISDGGLYYYIQDVIVLPEYQGRGIGRNIMDKLMEFIHKNASTNSIVGLMSASGKEEFYELFGFIKRPTNFLGCGMTICL